jgi:hypothetical protein
MPDDAPRTGRPLKLLNDELRERLLDAVARGMSHTDAARAAGVDRVTFQRWLARGRDAADQLDDGAGDIPDSERPYLEFYEALTRAHARGQDQAAELLNKVMTGGYVLKTRTRRYRDPATGHVIEETEDDIAPPDLKGITFYLERRHAATWGRGAEQVELSGPGGGPVEMTSDANLMAVAERVHAARLALEAEPAADDDGPDDDGADDPGGGPDEPAAN